MSVYGHTTEPSHTRGRAQMIDQRAYYYWYSTHTIGVRCTSPFSPCEAEPPLGVSNRLINIAKAGACCTPPHPEGAVILVGLKSGLIKHTAGIYRTLGILPMVVQYLHNAVLVSHTHTHAHARTHDTHTCPLYSAL